MTERKTGRRPGVAVHSVFVRCALIMTVTTLAVAAVMFVQAADLARTLALRGVVEQAQKASAAGAEAMAAPLRFKAVAKLEEEAQKILAAAGKEGRLVIVMNAEGEILAQAGARGGGADLLQTMLEAARASGTVQAGPDGLIRALPVKAGAEGPVLGVLGIVWSADHALAETNAAKLRIAGTAAAIFLGMMVVTVLVLRRTLGQPLQHLTAAVDRVARGDYDSAVGLDGRRDELGQIAAQLQALTGTLRQSREAEEQRRTRAETQAEVVRHLGRALDVLAAGVLTHEIHEDFPEEYETLRRNYNRAVDSLRAVVAGVGENASDILRNAEQIASASDDLSRRTETQAATLEQSAAALEELLNSVNTAAGNARKAEETVRHTRSIAVQNGEVMNSAVEAMGAIEKSSERIGDIIGVIDDIAFQTNLLALNAGVEAARAGESGKGFAVVASEVRGLAQRSAEAAQQIKELIVGSGEQVDAGVKLVERAGEALRQVVSQVAEVADMVTGIAHGAGEQAGGLNEINVGVANLDTVTQQNAAMVEQSTAAAHRLRTGAMEMRRNLDTFVIDADRASPGPRRAA